MHDSWNRRNCAVGYDDLSAAVANWQELTSGSGVGLNESWPARGLLQMDPPQHETPREVLQAIMSFSMLRSMKAGCMELAGGIIGGLLTGATPGSTVEVDGHRDIGSKLPVNFFPEALRARPSWGSCRAKQTDGPVLVGSAQNYAISRKLLSPVRHIHEAQRKGHQ